MAIAALAALAMGTSLSYAQASCDRLAATLATLDRNGDFQDVSGNSRAAKQLKQEVQRNESAYVRNGCNADAKAGRPLTRECRALAREITQGRKDYQEMLSTVETGNAVAEQREAILREMSRFDCDSRDDQFGNDDGPLFAAGRRERGNIFEQLFDALGDSFGDGSIRGEEFDPWGDYHTVRTLCVRKSDGFYWPISYSTLTDYVANDLDQCQQMCPGLDVDLYYYDNPGQEPEQMINTYGEPYTALPTAFRFRTEIDAASTCKPVVTYGSIQIADLGDGRSRPVIELPGKTFPLPLRDPRQAAQVTHAALVEEPVLDIPLPRRRPARPGEDVKPVPAAQTPVNQLTIVDFNGKTIRLVGPDTSDVRAAAAGT